MEWFNTMPAWQKRALVALVIVLLLALFTTLGIVVPEDVFWGVLTDIPPDTPVPLP